MEHSPTSATGTAWERTRWPDGVGVLKSREELELDVG
jgi:hypothetical protein